MLEHIDSMTKEEISTASDTSKNLTLQGESRFLTALLCWGTYQNLLEHIKMFRHQAKHDVNLVVDEQALHNGLLRRNKQSAVCYLDFPIGETSPTTNSVEDFQRSIHHTTESLYSIEQMIEIISTRTSLNPLSKKNSSSSSLLPETLHDSRIVLDAMARLCMMTGKYDDALSFFLEIGSRHSAISVSHLEDMALASVYNDSSVDYSSKQNVQTSYSYLLHFIEQHHLFQNLLANSSMIDECSNHPIMSLIRLLGLDMVRKFLIRSASLPTSSNASKLDIERRGTLPIDLVANQLSGSPKLLLWYLHSIFISKPEIYVKFPNTANPPQEIVNLHRKHLDLAIKYAGRQRDSVKVLDGIELYRVLEVSTPLLMLLKVSFFTCGLVTSSHSRSNVFTSIGRRF
jgi:vacuolar protein sorting-associated protein 41